jgi:hypothetical protein
MKPLPCNEEDFASVELKHCPRCEETLPLSEFGVCRSRKDGLNLYCKRCIRQKIADARTQLKDYKRKDPNHGNRNLHVIALTPQGRLNLRRLRKLSHADRVLRSLGIVGTQSFKELRYSCSLTEEQLSEALAHVVGFGLPVGTRNGTDPRVYFLKAKAEVIAQLEDQKSRDSQTPARVQIPRPYKPRDISAGLSFSTIRFLMPARITRS